MRPLNRLAPSAALAFTLGLGACHVHRGAKWHGPERPPHSERAGPTLVVLGNAGADSWAARETARRVGSMLTRERAAGRGTVLLWVGGNVDPGRGRHACDDGRKRTAPALAAVGHGHVSEGRPSFAATGPRDWVCGAPTQQLQATAHNGPHPWSMPSSNYVVHVESDGAARVASRCDDRACTIATPSPTCRVSLVFVDTTPWLAPSPAGSKARVEADRQLAQMRRLLDALPPVGVPRLLVMVTPVESSGFHGQGAGGGEATFHRLPDRIKRHLVDGTFEGVLSGFDASLQVSGDLSPWVLRSDKTRLNRPAFQLVSGAAGGSPRGKEAIPYYRGIAIRPDLESTRPGFALVRVFEEAVEIELHARKPQGWRVGRIHIPLRRAAPGVETEAPSTAPCLRCPDVPPDGG